MKNLLDKKLILALPLILLILATYNLKEGYQMIGKVFPGFGIEFSLTYSPLNLSHWTGNNAGFKDYDQITEINGEKINNIYDLNIKLNKNKFKENTYTIKRNNKLNKVKVNSMIFQTKDFVSTFGITIFIGLIYLLLSIFVSFNKKKNDKIKPLYFSLIFMSIGFISFSDFDLTKNTPFITLIVYSLLPFYLIKLSLKTIEINISKKFLYISDKTNNLLGYGFLITLLSSYILINNNLNNHQFIYKFYLFIYLTNALYIAFGFLFFICSQIYNFYKSNYHSYEKTQSRIIFTAGIVSFLPYIILWLIPSVFGYHSIVSTTYLIIPFILFPFAISYAIVKYKAFDLEFYIRKTIIYSNLSGVLLSSYFTLSAIITVLAKKIFYFEGEYTIAFSAVAATLITGKFKEKIQNIIDKVFYQQKVDLKHQQEKYSKETINIFEKEILIEKTVDYLEKTLSPSFIEIYQFEEKNLNNIFSNRNNENYLDLEIFDNEENIILNFKNGKDILGKIILGSKKSETQYYIHEKEFLNNLIISFSFAFSNLKIKKQALESANKAEVLNLVSRSLSHDLQVPLANCDLNIQSTLYLLEKGIYSKKLEHRLAKAGNSLKKAKTYIVTSLDRELLELGKLNLLKEEVSVHKSIEESISVNIDLLKENYFDLELNLVKKDIFIKSDKIRFEHIISNFITNAVKYGQDKISIKSLINQDNSITISFMNEGEPIEDSLKDKVFELYAKGKNTSKYKSTGLGLSICKTYIENMNGKIWLKNNQNGVTFYINLPIERVDKNITNKIIEFNKLVNRVS